jgi:hypothetical protein
MWSVASLIGLQRNSSVTLSARAGEQGSPSDSRYAFRYASVMIWGDASPWSSLIARIPARLGLRIVVTPKPVDFRKSLNGAHL